MTVIECVPAQVLADWEQFNAASDESVTCDTSKPDIERCNTYTKWTQWTYGLGYTVMLAEGIISQALKPSQPEIAKKISKGFHALYFATKGVNSEFVTAIKDFNEDKPYEPVDDPSILPDWPDVEEESAQSIKDILTDAWEVIKPILKAIVTKLAKGSALMIAFDGLISAADDVIDELSKIFE
ncbi:MAG: hypothetical protein QNJ09_14840 [Paracoccaceae bacterium]|nr:hypothetical protein [Paracoccaceae bacterium]